MLISWMNKHKKEKNSFTENSVAPKQTAAAAAAGIAGTMNQSVVSMPDSKDIFPHCLLQKEKKKSSCVNQNLARLTCPTYII